MSIAEFGFIARINVFRFGGFWSQQLGIGLVFRYSLTLETFGGICAATKMSQEAHISAPLHVRSTSIPIG